jgi:hypothetical protein
VPSQLVLTYALSFASRQENGLVSIRQDVQASWDYMKEQHAALRRAKLLDPNAFLPPSTTVTTTSHLLSVQRQKRCVLAYLNARAEKIRAVWWETGVALPEELRQVLSRHESTFLQKYDDLMSTYMMEAGFPDLTADQTPPKDLYVAVQAARGTQINDLMTSQGPVNVDDNSEMLMRRTDAEMLIRQGQLVQVHKE